MILQQLVSLHDLGVSALPQDLQLVLQQRLVRLAVVNQLLVHYFDCISLLFFFLLGYDLALDGLFSIGISVFADCMRLTVLAGCFRANAHGSERTVTEYVSVLVTYFVMILNFANSGKLFDFPRYLLPVVDNSCRTLVIVFVEGHLSEGLGLHGQGASIFDIEELTIRLEVARAV